MASERPNQATRRARSVWSTAVAMARSLTYWANGPIPAAAAGCRASVFTRFVADSASTPNAANASRRPTGAESVPSPKASTGSIRGVLTRTCASAVTVITVDTITTRASSHRIHDLTPVGRCRLRTLNPVACGASTLSGGGIIADCGCLLTRRGICRGRTARRPRNHHLRGLQ